MFGNLFKGLLISLPLLFVPTNSKAQESIFIPPPIEMIIRGQELDADSFVMFTTQGEELIRVTCDQTVACFKNNDGLCTIFIWSELPLTVQLIVLQNLLARCAGWTPE